jgi:uncharacterized membrane protein YfhO
MSLNKTLRKLFFSSILFIGVIVVSKPLAGQEITAINFNGEPIGKVIPDGKVVSFDNKLIGNINVSNSGYMSLSIPYDQGFTIKVDGEKIDYENVNNGFLGFPILEGNHNIEITYNSPWYTFGLIVTILGIILWFFSLLHDLFFEKKFLNH